MGWQDRLGYSTGELFVVAQFIMRAEDDVIKKFEKPPKQFL